MGWPPSSTSSRSDASRELDRAVVAEELLDRVADQVGVVAQRGQLVGVAEQGQGAVADQVHGRLVAGQVEEDDLVAQLGWGEAVAFLLGGDERAEKVVGGLAALPLDRRLDVLGDVVAGVEDGGQLVGDHDRLEGLHQGVGPLAQLGPVVLGHAEQLGDHRERQREGQVGDDVHPASRRDLVEHPVDEALDPGQERVDAPRREGLLGEATDAGVVGRVKVQHGPVAPLAALDAGRLEQRAAGHGGGVALLHRQARVTQQPGAVLVAGDRPRPDRAAVDRRDVPQGPILLVGVGEVAGRERVQPDLGDRGRPPPRRAPPRPPAECTDRRPARPACPVCTLPSLARSRRLHSFLLSHEPHGPQLGGLGAGS